MTYYAVTEGTAIEDVGGITVIMSNRGDSAILNGTADAILRITLTGKDELAIAEMMTDLYDVSEDAALEDVRSVHMQLLRYGMLEELNM